MADRFSNKRPSNRQAAQEIDMDKNKERVVFVYTTYPSIVEAERIGRELVQRRLCACVNILPGMVSLLLVGGRDRARRGGGDDHQDPRRAGRSGSGRRCGSCTPIRPQPYWCCRSRASIRITMPGSWRKPKQDDGESNGAARCPLSSATAGVDRKDVIRCVLAFGGHERITEAISERSLSSCACRRSLL